MVNQLIRIIAIVRKYIYPTTFKVLKNGGGAGGNAGGAWTYCLNDRDEYTVTIGARGARGLGSDGADGGDGVVLIYS